MVALWEVVGNDGESRGFFPYESQAWIDMAVAEVGSRLVGYFDGETIVVEWEKGEDAYVMHAPCQECSKHSFGECYECQLANTGV